METTESLTNNNADESVFAGEESLVEADEFEKECFDHIGSVGNISFTVNVILLQFKERCRLQSKKNKNASSKIS